MMTPTHLSLQERLAQRLPLAKVLLLLPLPRMTPTLSSLQERPTLLRESRQNCKSYTISVLQFCVNILHSNLYSPICIILFLLTRFGSSSSDEDFPSAVDARGVGKSNGDKTDDNDKLYDKDDKDVPSIGKNLMRILDLSVFHPLLEVMSFKITILNVTILAKKFLDLSVIWP